MAKSSEVPFVLNARTDVYLRGTGDDATRFKETVRRAKAYQDAGADCVFPIGLRERETIARLVREMGCPMNVMAGPGAPTIAELEQLGVRRVTFGTGLMRATLPSIRKMARELRASGICDSLAQTEFTHATMNQLFKP
jgi:2-methylisocitrate lyase-like PEP mutase family enzyme